MGGMAGGAAAQGMGSMVGLVAGLGGAIGGAIRGARNRNTSLYNSNVNVGGAFSPQGYQGPMLQQGGPAQSSMNMVAPGFAENYAAMNNYRTGPQSTTRGVAQEQHGQLGQLGQQERTFQQNRGMLSGQSATGGYNQSAMPTLRAQGQGEQYFNQVQGRFNQPTNAQSMLNTLQANQPNFDSFYNRARERQAGGMNDQLAARGMYGSSAGVDMISEGMADLNAQQANREFDATLQQQGQMLNAAGQADSQNQGLLGLGINAANSAQSQQLARMGLAGQLAGQEDQVGVGRFNALMGGAGASDAGQLARLGAQMGNAQATDQVDLSRLMGGFQMAQGAQGAREGRIQQGFNNVMLQQQMMNNTLGQYLPLMLNTDASYLDSALGAELGGAVAGTNAGRYLDQEGQARTASLLNMIGNLMNVGGQLGKQGSAAGWF